VSSTKWKRKKHNKASKPRHALTLSARDRFCPAPLCGRVERSLAIPPGHESARPRLQCRGSASGRPYFTSRGRRQTAHLRHAAACSHPQLALVAGGVRPSTPSPDGGATSARRPPCTSRRSRPMAAVHGQREGEKTTAGAGRDLGDTHRRIASRPPYAQHVRGFRPYWKGKCAC
jgi:hypothetical protein